MLRLLLWLYYLQIQQGELYKYHLYALKTLYGVVIDNVLYKHLEAKKILITDEEKNRVPLWYSFFRHYTLEW